MTKFFKQALLSAAILGAGYFIGSLLATNPLAAIMFAIAAFAAAFVFGKNAPEKEDQVLALESLHI